MSILENFKNSELGLKGETPKIKASATKQSAGLVFDPTPGNQGDEQYNIVSELDLDGKTPKSYRDNAPEEASF